MPYNLRKRTRPAEAAEPVEVVVKRRKSKAKPEAKTESKTKHEVKAKLPAPVEVSVKESKSKKTARRQPKTSAEPRVKPEVKVEEPMVVDTTAAEKVESPSLEPKSKSTARKQAKADAELEVKAEEPMVVDQAAEEKVEVSVQELKPRSTGRRQLVFGVDHCGELGMGKTGFMKKNPTAVPLEEPIKMVACGAMFTLSLTFEGEIYSYGCNDDGALGRKTDGDEELESTPTKIQLKKKVIKITAGDSHGAALTDENEIYVWGNFKDEDGSWGLTPESEGKVNFEPIQIVKGTEITDIASGSNHMLLLDNHGCVYSFGVGAKGQLGRLKPEDIITDGGKITPEKRSLYLTPQKVNLKDVDPQRPFICDAIYAGNSSSFATNTDKKKNRLAGWGLNNYFQLGYKGSKDLLVQHNPRRTTFTCSTNIVGVACGQHHTLFLTKTGRVYSAGCHDYGMLGLGDIDTKVCPARCIETLGNSVVAISASGLNSSFAVTKEGKLYSWGAGDIHLGFGGEDDVKIPTEVEKLKDEKVVSVSAYFESTSVLVD